MSSNREWHKVLYEHHGYPDNFHPPTFLKDLRKNVNLRHYTLLESVVAAGRLAQEISAIVALVTIFLTLEARNIKAAIPVCIIIACSTFVLYAALILVSSAGFVRQLKSAVVFFVSGFAFSPILKTLTETISTDTVYAMVTIMMAAHLIFYDYGAQSAIVSTPISLNAGVFGAVCLASRLPTTYHAFAFLICASDVFVLSTILRKRWRESLSLGGQAFITLASSLIALVSTFATTSFAVALVFFVLMIFINFIFPYGFYKWQSSKENIYGPWDEAVIQTSPRSTVASTT